MNIDTINQAPLSYTDGYYVETGSAGCMRVYHASDREHPIAVVCSPLEGAYQFAVMLTTLQEEIDKLVAQFDALALKVAK